MNVVRFFGFVAGMMLSGTAVAGSVEIPQVPANAEPVGNAEAAIKPENNEGKDYQAEVLSNPAINDRARAEAIMNSGDNSGGNTAVIVQKGNSNKSSIVQYGSNNSASQTQDGKLNDLRVEQNGNNNTSQENQIGDYNHKVKIQNGEESEETTIEQTVPVQNDK